MLCGKGGFKTLTKHLGQAHGTTPSLYRKQFGISFNQPLTTKSYSEQKRRTAVERGLADKLAKTRELRRVKMGPKNPVEEVVAEDLVGEGAETI